jgi:hypothetical protein
MTEISISPNNNDPATKKCPKITQKSLFANRARTTMNSRVH